MVEVTLHRKVNAVQARLFAASDRGVVAIRLKALVLTNF